jgi:hypothetical protein
MPREARFFSSRSGSAVRGFLKYRANIPPRWIRNARTSRKRIEPEIAEAFRSFARLRKGRPRAHLAIRTAQEELRAVLNRWEISYSKENFIAAYASSLSSAGAAHRTCRRAAVHRHG